MAEIPHIFWKKHEGMITMPSCEEKIYSEDYRDFILSGERAFWKEILKKELCRVPLEYSFEILYASLPETNNYPLYVFPYPTVPKCYALLDMQALSQAGISQIQMFPGLELYGEGVILGFIDTGINYMDPVFRQLDGRTRILRIWDQTIRGGRAPEGLPYGSEYTREEIDRAILSDAPERVVPSKDEIGHGTFVASIACGAANVENQFQGVAPESEIVVVKLKEAKQYLRDFYFIESAEGCYQENDIMAGLFYLHNLALREKKPLIICLALGTSMGGHSGSTPLPAYMEVLGNVLLMGLVAGTGNEADKRHHFQGQIEENMTEKIEISVGNNVKGFVMEIWTEIPNVMSVSIISPTGENSGQIPVRVRDQGYDYVFEQTRVNISYRLFERTTDSQLIFLQFDNPLSGIWRVNVQGVQLGDGIFHAWLMQQEFLAGEVFFLKSNPDVTIMEPGNTISVACAAYYNGADKGVAVSSGRGYTRTNIIKPDFAAPGINVLGVNLRGQFVERSGSSIATAITAGAEALLMEWLIRRGETVDSKQLKNMLILGTSRMDRQSYPNRKWGNGLLNLYQTFEALRRL